MPWLAIIIDTPFTPDYTRAEPPDLSVAIRTVLDAIADVFSDEESRNADAAHIPIFTVCLHDVLTDIRPFLDTTPTPHPLLPPAVGRDLLSRRSVRSCSEGRITGDRAEADMVEILAMRECTRGAVGSFHSGIGL